jgi:hypothetical protein
MHPSSGTSIAYTTTNLTSSSSTKDVGSQALAHISALSHILQPLINKADELEEMKKEVEMWRAAWGQSERDKRGLEGRLQDSLKGVPVRLFSLFFVR